MLRSDRLTAAVRARGKSLITAGSKHAAATRSHRKSIVLTGAALALVGAGAATAASAAAADGPAQRSLAAPDHPVRPPVTAPPHRGALIAAPGRAARRAAASHAPASHPAVSHPAVSRPAALTWAQVRDAISRETSSPAARHGKLPAADQLMPVGTSGQQEWMPIDSSQGANATTIVRQALRQRMGIRSAVIAVATASRSRCCRTSTMAPVPRSACSSSSRTRAGALRRRSRTRCTRLAAFLSALQRHQASDASWARQPLWANAQAVQNSAFPLAYAKWESQAASLVRHIAMREAHTKLIAANLR